MGVAYNRCLQVSFIIVQLLFICLGAIMIALGVWLEVQDQNFEAIIDGDEILYGPYLIIAAGCGVIAVAVVGMFGACCDHRVNRILLLVYIILVIVVFVLQTIGGILAFSYREEVFDFVRDGLNETLPEYNGEGAKADGITEAWDFVQETLTCCGVNNLTDWETVSAVDLWPDSCCSGETNTSSSADRPCPLDEVYEDGCEDALTEFIQNNLLVVATVGITFVVAEVIVVLMAVCLLCCTDFDDDLCC